MTDVSKTESTTTEAVTTDASVEYCGEWFTLDRNKPFDIGRDADLDIDDNQYLHRRFLQIAYIDGLWWLINVGSRLSASISDATGSMQAWLAPGARLPVVFGLTSVVFTAGPTTYEFVVHTSTPAFVDSKPVSSSDGTTTVGAVTFTRSQWLLILALAEPMLKREGTGTSEIPSSAAAAERLGWVLSRFNRKLDNVCDKLSRQGVDGLRGGVGALATNRRARLVEYAVLSRLVTPADLPALDDDTADTPQAPAATGSKDAR